MGQFQAFLSVALELQNVGAGFGLTCLECIEQVFKFFHCVLGFGLCLGLAGRRGVLQFGARFVQFFLCLTALLFQFGEQFFSISQGLGTSVFQMFEQAARKLLEQMQRSVYRLLIGRHGLPPG
ncbi:hypothetical protein BK635_24100 [Pseudomonas chlororaphis]|nr:hypothetical protein BK637_01805 [Pseudomonas chlororaphis]RON76493.1 hypothetical protein BK635_24100 [Pseudomonas chlororaphis]